MTQRKTGPVQKRARPRAGEAMRLAKHTRIMTDERELESCRDLRLESTEKLAAALEKLELDADLLLLQAVREPRAEEAENTGATTARGLIHRALRSLPTATRRSVTVALIAGGLAAWAAIHYGYGSREIPPTFGGNRVELRDGSVVTTDPDTPVHVDYTFSERNVDLRFGGAVFQVHKNRRSFNVSTPVGTATALGTEFFVELDGPRQAPEALVRVRVGSVSVKPRSAAQKPVTLEANQQVRFGLEGPVTVVQVPTADVREFEDEPLVRVAAVFNKRHPGPRFVIQGGACRYRVMAALDVEEPTQFSDEIGRQRELRAYDRGDVVYVRDATDPAPEEGAVQEKCDLMAGGAPAVMPTASH